MEEFLIAGIPVLLGITAVGITVLVIGVQLARSKRRRQLLQHAEMAVARVVNISQTGTATTAKQLMLDIDKIGAAPRRVTITQIIDGAPPDVGERVYILVDSDDPNVIALLPASMTNGQRIPAMANRLDALVLGPQILREGAKATGTMVSAIRQPMNNQALEAKGCSKWQLVIDVKPEDGSFPYQATLVISFTNPEKAERAARVGAEVPLRYDPMDRQTFAIDSIAMGYDDPYEAVRKMMLPTP
jgi:hypothetical protein